MKQDTDQYRVQPYPRNRVLMVDGGRLGRQRHTVHGLVEFDVTCIREMLHQHKAKTGESLSFTAFFLSCLGRAIDENKRMHAYRNWRNQVVIFENVDINTLFEVEIDGKKTIRPHILRAVNTKSFREIHDEIRAFQQAHETSQESRFIESFVRLPGWMRRFFLRVLFMNPGMIKKYYGTVMVTSIGMFAEGGGWGIPVSSHTLQLTLGGIATKPGVVGDRIEIREYLSVTVSLDHDLIDGAPAARFIQRLKALVEDAHVRFD